MATWACTRGGGRITQRLSHQNNIPGPRLPPEHQRHTKKMHGGSERCTPSKLGAFLRILWYLRHGYGDFWCLKPDTRQARWLHCDSPGHHREPQRHLGPHKRTPWGSDFTFYYFWGFRLWFLAFLTRFRDPNRTAFLLFGTNLWFCFQGCFRLTFSNDFPVRNWASAAPNTLIWG